MATLAEPMEKPAGSTVAVAGCEQAKNMAPRTAASRRIFLPISMLRMMIAA
jgi:hypothetical protein